MLRRIVIAIALVALVSACGGPGGRCGLLDKGYPLCGI
jgi:hypothetical protein